MPPCPAPRRNPQLASAEYIAAIGSPSTMRLSLFVFSHRSTTRPQRHNSALCRAAVRNVQRRYSRPLRRPPPPPPGPAAIRLHLSRLMAADRIAPIPHLNGAGALANPPARPVVALREGHTASSKPVGPPASGHLTGRRPRTCISREPSARGRQGQRAKHESRACEGPGASLTVSTGPSGSGCAGPGREGEKRHGGISGGLFLRHPHWHGSSRSTGRAGSRSLAVAVVVVTLAAPRASAHACGQERAAFGGGGGGGGRTWCGHSGVGMAMGMVGCPPRVSRNGCMATTGQQSVGECPGGQLQSESVLAVPSPHQCCKRVERGAPRRIKPPGIRFTCIDALIARTGSSLPRTDHGPGKSLISHGSYTGAMSYEPYGPAGLKVAPAALPPPAHGPRPSGVPAAVVSPRSYL
ncbi:hypothetical protein BU16DRAFT_541906 [Lophium mytilinum]|uniref:Uncharacterized protein n=1 Tax=Lophium mytilinum TaxID=390894 RepID=A0A6A6QJV9_9PEZI|nr:hypothetical protein BU16DRAFT_541906 [Lophium mytilinum]